MCCISNLIKNNALKRVTVAIFQSNVIITKKIHLIFDVVLADSILWP